jgi:FKBP12-rapamycin complex-associated protein
MRSFLDKVIPAFHRRHSKCYSTRLESYFSQLSVLVTIVRQHIRNYLPDIVNVLQEFGIFNSLQANILQLVEAISRSLEGEFKIYLAGLLPLMLGVLEKIFLRDACLQNVFSTHSLSLDQAVKSTCI